MRRLMHLTLGTSLAALVLLSAPARSFAYGQNGPYYTGNDVSETTVSLTTFTPPAEWGEGDEVDLRGAHGDDVLVVPDEPSLWDFYRKGVIRGAGVVLTKLRKSL